MNHETLPPQDLEAERSVLGSMMLSPDAVDDALSILSPESFYSEKHGKLFAAIRDMSLRHTAVDPVTLGHELARRGELDQVGGPAYLVQVLEAVPHAAHVKHYARIVREKADRRFVIEQATEMLRTAYHEPDHESALAKTEQAITRMVERSAAGNDATDLQTILIEAVDRIERGEVQGLSTGFRRLDERCTGIHPGQLIVIGARPGHGKTAFGVNMMHLLPDVPVAYFSLEMSAIELAERMLSLECRLSVVDMRAGNLDEQQRWELSEGANQLNGRKVYIMDDPDTTVMRISAMSRLMKRKRNIGLVIIDYLQLINPDDKRVPRHEQVAEMSRSLKKLAKSLQIPVIVMAQLNRNIENRTDKRPRLADLRESGAIEQDADQVWLLYCPFKDADPTSPEYEDSSATVFVAKNRSGPDGHVSFEVVKDMMQFRDPVVQDAFN